MIKLKSALGNDLSGSVIQENVEYYDSYIREEMSKGRTESEVTAELGDPWVIAQTIIDSAENRMRTQSQKEYSSEEERTYGNNRSNTGKIYSFGLNTWWKKLLLLLAILGVVMIIGAVIGGIISFVAPVLLPVIIVLIILKAFNNKE